MARNLTNATDVIEDVVSVASLPLSMAVRIKPNSTTTTQYIFGLYDLSDNFLWMNVGQVSTGRFFLWYRNGGSSVQSTNIFSDNNYYDLVLIVKSTSDVELWVDDVLEINHNPGVAFPSNLTNLTVGETGDGTPQAPVKGDYADFLYWDKEVTAREVTMYSSKTPALLIGHENQVRYWPIQGNISPSPDFSGNGGTGALTGTTKADHPPVELLENYL